MVFAEIREKLSVEELLNVLKRQFDSIEWGDQGTNESPDAYFWIHQEGVKVSVDNLTSMEFQVKCDRSDSPLIKEVIDVLSQAFKTEVFASPEREAHE